MKTSDMLILAGVGLGAYILWKRQQVGSVPVVPPASSSLPATPVERLVGSKGSAGWQDGKCIQTSTLTYSTGRTVSSDILKPDSYCTDTLGLKKP